jgi:hypothetical protein
MSTKPRQRGGNGRSKALPENAFKAELAGVAEYDVAGLGDVLVEVQRPGGRPVTPISQKKISALSAISTRLRERSSITRRQRNTPATMSLTCSFSSPADLPGNIILTCGCVEADDENENCPAYGAGIRTTFVVCIRPGRAGKKGVHSCRCVWNKTADRLFHLTIAAGGSVQHDCDMAACGARMQPRLVETQTVG